MAIVSQVPVSNEEELKKKQAAPSGVVTGGQAAAPKQQAPSAGRFTNIQKYLQAQGPQAGQQIMGRVQQDVTRKQQDVQQKSDEVSKIKEAVDATKTKIGGAGQAQQDIQSAASSTGYGKQEADQTAALGKLQQHSNLVNYLTSQGYSTDLAKAQADSLTKGAAAGSALGTLGERATALGTEKGRSDILRQLYNRPTYGAGQQRLDQLLLQRAQGSQGGLRELQKDAAKQFGAQQAQLGQLSQDIAAGITTGKELGAKAETDIKSALTSGLSSIEAAQAQEAARKNVERQNIYNQAVGRLKEGKLGRTDAQAMGLIDAQGNLKDVSAMGMIGQLGGDEGNALAQKIFQQGKALSDVDVLGQKEFDIYKTLADLSKAQSKYSGIGTEGKAYDIGKSPEGEAFLTSELARRGGEFREGLKGLSFGSTGIGTYSNIGGYDSETGAPIIAPAQRLEVTNTSNIYDLLNKSGALGGLQMSNLLSTGALGKDYTSDIAKGNVYRGGTEDSDAFRQAASQAHSSAAKQVQDQLDAYLKSKGAKQAFKLVD